MKATLVCLILVLVSGSVLAGAQPGLLDQLLGQYYSIQQKLASDSTSGISAAAQQMADISRKAAATRPSDKAQLTAIEAAAAKLQGADLKSARNVFGELSDRLISFLQNSQVRPNPPYQFYCPMVRKNWLQPDKEIRNPYYGSSMLTCGELVQAPKSAGQDAKNVTH
jgi:hypothetical protein